LAHGGLILQEIKGLEASLEGATLHVSDVECS
jgi:hypothetical protein